MANGADDTCCICLKKCYFLESINQCDTSNVKYSEKLKLCVPEQFWQDGLNVCNDCIEKLDIAYDFIQICLQSEEYRKERIQILSEIKLKEEEDASLFECDKCGKQFKLKRSLKLHITRIHFKTHSRLKREKIEDVDIKEDAQETVEEYSTNDDFKKELVDIHNNLLDCENVILENNDAINHSKHSDDENFETNENDFYLSEEEDDDRKRIKKALKRKPRKRKCPVQCEYCDLIFARMDKYVQHVRSKHTFERPFKCDLCDAAYYSSHNLSIHKRKHRNEKPYVCTICGKSFVSSNDLWQHTKIHNAVREYKCTECDRCKYRFFLQTALNCHFPDCKHREEPLLPCLVKNFFIKCYKTHSNLRTHKIQMHLDPSLWKFICTVCGKKFPLNNNLIKHMRRHDGIKPFGCYLCEKRFVEKIDMQTHLLSHSNERSHKCSLCAKEYKKKETLRRHLKVEHDIGDMLIKKPEKKLPCPMCPKVFAFNNKLQRHLLTHTGEKPVKCDYCEKRFRDNYDRNIHYRKEHNIEFISRENNVF